VSVQLPTAFVNLGELPVLSIGSPDCGPPGNPFVCSTSVLLQGWPQSLEVPFPGVAWDEATNTITLTSTVDWGAVDGPGVKQVHLLLFGFQNPRPGDYDIEVTIQPNPDSGETLSGTATVHILDSVQPAIGPISVINPGPPPPFPNSRYQTVALGETPLRWGFYLWDKDGNGIVGADIVRTSNTHYRLVDAAGGTIGEVRISTPDGAGSLSLESVEPAVAANAFASRIPTALLTLQFTPDPGVAGEYVATVQLRDARGPIPLARGLNEIVYPGPTRPVAEALVSIAGGFTTVWHWDNASQLWSAFRPGFEFLSDLKQLVPGEVYWIDVDRATPLFTGSSTRMFVTVTN
jgi:hypothetical protein